MNKNIFTVSELTLAITKVLREGVGYVVVQGEISNYKGHSSGHRYFTLKDFDAQISCVLWRTRSLNFQPVDGMKVIARGNITVYPPRGQYQLDCISIEPLGQGDLYLAYEELKRKLEAQGYFAAERKKPIPTMPLKIGVSTSSTGAAVRDIFTTIERRFPACIIYFRPTLVQGDGSAEDIAKAISELQTSDAEVIIIGRGGGSLEDLWSFNTEIVADAIFNSKIPIVSAVGHETDFTIADFVADIRAATPTAAAELVTYRTSRDILTDLSNIDDYLNKLISNNIRDLHNDIDDLANSYAFRRMSEKLMNFMQQVDESEINIEKRIKMRLDYQHQKINFVESHCKSLYPLAPLGKGFAILRSTGRYLTNMDSLINFKDIDIIRKNEIASVTVNSVKEEKDISFK